MTRKDRARLRANPWKMVDARPTRQLAILHSLRQTKAERFFAFCDRNAIAIIVAAFVIARLLGIELS